MACVMPKLGLFGGCLKPSKKQSPKPGAAQPTRGPWFLGCWLRLERATHLSENIADAAAETAF
jgi:hypothetical protein